MTLVGALLGCKGLSRSDTSSSSAPEGTAAPTLSATTTASAAPEAAVSACGQAIACCKLVAAKSGNSPRECEKFQKYSEKSCASSLAQLRQAGKILGLDCKAAGETK